MPSMITGVALRLAQERGTKAMNCNLPEVEGVGRDEGVCPPFESGEESMICPCNHRRYLNSGYRK